jgi:hypothetical protein
LVERVHRDLSANVRADIARQEAAEPAPSTLAELVAHRDWLFGQYSYHLDTTHLASTVRYARVLSDPAALRLAYDLTAYGRRLHEQFQYRGEAPFEEIHASHELYFGALLGQNVPAAVEYFRQQAESQPAAEVGPLPAEVYVDLLARLGRFEEAAAASARLLTPEIRTTGFAPSLLELSERGGSYETLLKATRERGDLVGFAAGLIGRHLKTGD